MQNQGNNPRLPEFLHHPGLQYSNQEIHLSIFEYPGDSISKSEYFNLNKSKAYIYQKT